MFTIGPKPSSLISGRTLLESLGDTAVDFTPLPDSDTLLILRGNGDVYMLKCELDGKRYVCPWHVITRYETNTYQDFFYLFGVVRLVHLLVLSICNVTLSQSPQSLSQVMY